ncbi:MAG TPA: hypothetical protein VF133_16195 [Terriglobales bacterium]
MLVPFCFLPSSKPLYFRKLPRKPHGNAIARTNAYAEVRDTAGDSCPSGRTGEISMGPLATLLPRLECAVCGNPKQAGSTWFVITENGWEDRLCVWKWNAQLAAQRTARPVCGQRHARELVVHWMITGCLHYPFASVPLGSQEEGVPHASFSREVGEEACQKIQLGELSVDRGGIARLLHENPLALNAVLDELMVALENETLEEPESDREADAVPTLRTV